MLKRQRETRELGSHEFVPESTKSDGQQDLFTYPRKVVLFIVFLPLSSLVTGIDDVPLELVVYGIGVWERGFQVRGGQEMEPKKLVCN